MRTSDRVQLSVVIATLSKPGTACRLAERIQELLPALDLEAVIVTPPGVSCPESGANVHHVMEQRRGVYAAYTAGVQAARGEYVWFVGDDDYPLDGLAALAAHLEEAILDVLVAPVVFSSGRIYRPTRSRLVLLFLNWCQQGVVYRRRLLRRHRFYRRLVVAADQFVNVSLRSDPALRIRFFPDPICLFGLNGISGRVVDRSYRALRPALAHRTLGRASFLVFRALLVVEPLVKYVVRLR
jgi:glycosyltransferase involved in cell wall biosynthesis